LGATGSAVTGRPGVCIGANPDNFDDYVRHAFPMGRLGTAEEVADVIVFTTSSRAHWINGRNIAVDGLEQPYAPIGRRPF
jgi:NAD(P)-dependent dehydrogenase (short-subunit alcohol dehydrogenase family)